MSEKEKEFYTDLGQKLYEQRRKFNRTQGSIAKCLGISQGTLSKIEYGKLELTAYQLHVLERMHFKL